MGQDLYEALYYKKLEGQSVQCMLCPKYCVIKPENSGFCRARKNISGKLYSMIYGKTTSIALDPIEKKPLYHFHPHELILSVGTRGCNLGCIFCQNWHISQNPEAYLQSITSGQIIQQAQRSGSFGIAYTYNEPFIWYEFILETAKLARKNKLENVLVTNGYVNKGPLEEILPFIAAMNIDLKSIEEEFYKDICKGTLNPVLEMIKRAKKDCHVEITNLIIPTLNDSDEQIQKLSSWIADNAGADTPLHLSRYFPCYELTQPPTPIETLEKAGELAKKKLKYVYLGNV
ncbi:MAG: AmmeMemoRadiSam system radical SAM enzyme [Candidatus Omnitrophota bacterium]